MNRPVWFLNMCALEDWNAPEAISSMRFWAPSVLKWLDETRIKGNPSSEAVCRVIRRLWSRACDLSRIQGDPAGLAAMIQVDRRIKGLV